jgi:hypothetical protein
MFSELAVFMYCDAIKLGKRVVNKRKTLQFRNRVRYFYVLLTVHLDERV